MSLRRLAAWAWTALILAACLLPARFLPVHEHGAGASPLPHLDKVVHFLLFLGFGLLWGGLRPVSVLTLGLAVVAVSELGQALPYVDRDPGLWDALADVAGILVGMAIIQIGKPGSDPTGEPEVVEAVGASEPVRGR